MVRLSITGADVEVGFGGAEASVHELELQTYFSFLASTVRGDDTSAAVVSRECLVRLIP